jgi:hypothetical protein
VQRKRDKIRLLLKRAELFFEKCTEKRKKHRGNIDTMSIKLDCRCVSKSQSKRESSKVRSNPKLITIQRGLLEAKLITIRNLKNRSSYKGHTVDALALRDEEGRGKLRKATVSRKQALTRRYPNGETRQE